MNRELQPVFICDSLPGPSPGLALPLAEVTRASGMPVAGIVSHHLLAAPLIDDWFSRLAAMRHIETFFILSPDHFDTGAEKYSITFGEWRMPEGSVMADKRLVKRLCSQFAVNPEPLMFYNEHGIHALVPFIHKHFPGSNIVPIAYSGEAPVYLPAARELAEGLITHLSKKSLKDTFLIVSSDFAHHNGPEVTAEYDMKTRKFLDNPGIETWIFAICDNSPAMYMLARLSETLRSPEMRILYHSDSYRLTGHGADDITSYFFTYLFEQDF